MNILQAMILGLVQGIAEFLPISSSGHLKIAEHLLGVSNVETNFLFFDVMLHFGTLIAVFVAYWQEISELFSEGLRMVHIKNPKSGKNIPARRLIIFLIVSLLPLFIILPIKGWIESLGSGAHGLVFVGVMLIVTGMLLYFSDRYTKGQKDEKSMTIVDALVVGVGQLIAVVPGLSRSGTTITAGTIRGFNRPFALKFSFLMSIPTVLAAVLLEVIDVFKTGLGDVSFWVCLVGMIVSAVSGYFAISFLKKLAERGKFGGFAFWCWGAGLFALIISLIS